MNLPAIVENLYLNKHSNWMEDVDDADIEPFVLQHWLAQNDEIRVQTRFLDKYVFTLPPKMFLTLAWSIIPKYSKMPFIKWTKKEDIDDKYGFLFTKIRKHLQLADNDFRAIKHQLITMIEKNKTEWFAAYGVEKKYWKLHNLDFEDIKKYGTNRMIPQKGLSSWGI